MCACVLQTTWVYDWRLSDLGEGHVMSAALPVLVGAVCPVPRHFRWRHHAACSSGVHWTTSVNRTCRHLWSRSVCFAVSAQPERLFHGSKTGAKTPGTRTFLNGFDSLKMQTIRQYFADRCLFRHLVDSVASCPDFFALRQLFWSRYRDIYKHACKGVEIRSTGQ